MKKRKCSCDDKNDGKCVCDKCQPKMTHKDKVVHDNAKKEWERE